jgi:hypothetical protein
MVFSLRSVRVACLGLAFASPHSMVFAQTASSPAFVSVPQPLLPSSFGGWTQTGSPEAGTTLESADQANADILKEYGLKDFAVAEYSHGGDHLTLHAKRFVDATGAFGAFTFYRTPAMRASDLGNDAVTDGHEILFWTGAILVDAVFGESGSPIRTGTEKAALKELVARIPKTAGPEGIAPSLPRYLPAEGLDTISVHYAIGPAAYVRSGGVLPPSVVDFSRDAEAVTAQYATHDGRGTLTVLEYPTPQMALGRAKAIDALLKQGGIPGGNALALGVRSSGPLVAVSNGNFSDREAQALREKVKYEATVTVNHPEGYVSEVKKTANLLLGIVYLTGILGAAAILLGLFLGGGRALVRVMLGKPASTLNDDTFISLRLRD